MGAELVPHQASRDLLQERRPVDRADRVAETVAAVVVVDDLGDAERFASSALITSIILTTNP